LSNTFTNNSEFPNGWVIEKIQNLVTAKKGKKPKNLVPIKNAHSLPYIDIKAFEKNIFERFTSADDGVRCTKDDILIVWDGSRSGLVGTNQNGLVGSTITALTPKNTILPKLLFYFLTSKFKILNTATKGGAIPHLDPEVLFNFKLCFPSSKSEQEKIISKLDLLLSKINEQRKEILQLDSWKLLKRFEKNTYNSMLDKAVNGELTQNWRKIHNLEKSWARETLKNILSEKSKNGLSPRPNDSPPGIPILRINAATSLWTYFIDESKYRFLPISDDLAQKYFLQKDDLLACRFNGNLHFVGRFALFQGKNNSMVYPDKLIRFRVDLSKILPEYLLFFMNCSKTRKIIESFCLTTAGNIGINGVNLNSIDVDLPSIDEQKEIIRILDEKRLMIQKNQPKINSMLTIKENLKKLDDLPSLIIGKAFEGALII